MPYTLSQRIAASAFEGVARFFFGLSTRHVRHACRWHLRGPLHSALESDQPLILAAWHQDVVPLFHYLVNFTAFPTRRHKFVMLASRSFDGEVTERIVRPWGFRFVRGSFGR